MFVLLSLRAIPAWRWINCRTRAKSATVKWNSRSDPTEVSSAPRVSLQPSDQPATAEKRPLEPLPGLPQLADPGLLATAAPGRPTAAERKARYDSNRSSCQRALTEPSSIA